jgi:hypothetical protein
MYLKTKSLKSVTPFHLNTKQVRIPYKDCSACKKNIKDWGGKKHLMNPLGTAYSDVWSEKITNLESAQNISKETLELISDLVDNGDTKILLIRQEKIDRKDADINQTILTLKNIEIFLIKIK